MTFSLPSLTLLASPLNQFEVLLHSPFAFAGGGLYSSLFFALLFFAAAGFLALAVLGGSLLPESGASPSLYGHYLLSSLVAFLRSRTSFPALESSAEFQRTTPAVAVGATTPLSADTPHLGWSLLLLLLLALAKVGLDVALEGLRAGTGYSWLTALAPKTSVADPPLFSPALDCCEALLASGRVPLEFFWGLLGAGRHGVFGPLSPLTWNSLTLPELLWHLLAGAPFPWHAFYALLLSGGLATVARLLAGEGPAGVCFQAFPFHWRMPGGISFLNPGDFFTLTLKVAGEPGTAPMRRTLPRKPSRGWALAGQVPNRVFYGKAGPLASNQVVVKPREIPILLNHRMTKGHFCWRPPVSPDSPAFARLFEPRYLEEARRLQRGHWENFNQMREGWAGFAYGDGGSHLSAKGAFSLNYSADRRDWQLLRDFAYQLGLHPEEILSREPQKKPRRKEGSWRLNVNNRPQVAFALKLFGPMMHPSGKQANLNIFSQKLLGKPLDRWPADWPKTPQGQPSYYVLGSVVSDGYVSLTLRKNGCLGSILVAVVASRAEELLFYKDQLAGGGISSKSMKKPGSGYQWRMATQAKIKRLAELARTPGQPLGAKAILCLSQASALTDLSWEGAFCPSHPRYGEWLKRLQQWYLYRTSVKKKAPVGRGEWISKCPELVDHPTRDVIYYPLANYAVIRPTASGKAWAERRASAVTDDIRVDADNKLCVTLRKTLPSLLFWTCLIVYEVFTKQSLSKSLI